jgi:hypothetical protein
MDNRFILVNLPMRPDDLARWLGCLGAAAWIRPTEIYEDGTGQWHMWQLVVPLLQTRATPEVQEQHASRNLQCASGQSGGVGC